MEAALIFPLVILAVVGMIKLGTELCAKVEKSSAEHVLYAQEYAEGGKLPAEKILRGKWYVK